MKESDPAGNRTNYSRFRQIRNINDYKMQYPDKNRNNPPFRYVLEWRF